MVAVKQKTVINPEVDEHAARELYLFTVNDSQLMRQQGESIRKNLITKKARGIYKTDLAIKLGMYLMESGAKKYAKEFGGTWNEMFNVPTRREAAKDFIESFEGEASLGNYDHLLPKKYQNPKTRSNPKAKYTLISYDNTGEFKIIAQSNDFDKLLNLKERKEQSERNTGNNFRYYSVGDTKNLEKKNPKAGAVRENAMRTRRPGFESARRPRTRRPKFDAGNWTIEYSDGTEDTKYRSVRELNKLYDNMNSLGIIGFGKNRYTENKLTQKAWAVGNPNDKAMTVFELEEFLIQSGSIPWSVLTPKEKSIVKSNSSIFTITTSFGRKYVVLTNWAIDTTKRNSTASDFRSHQKITLENLSKMFQGGLSGDNRRVMISDYTPKNTSRLGYLVQMKVKQNGRIIPINFSDESYLSADTRKNLHACGKDARIGNIRNGLPRKGTLKLLGDLVQFDYVTAKNHIEGGKTVRFWHKTGEVTKEHPKLFIDHDGFPVIQGGTYDLWSVGVVN